MPPVGPERSVNHRPSTRPPVQRGLCLDHHHGSSGATREPSLWGSSARPSPVDMPFPTLFGHRATPATVRGIRQIRQPTRGAVPVVVRRNRTCWTAKLGGRQGASRSDGPHGLHNL